MSHKIDMRRIGRDRSRPAPEKWARFRQKVEAAQAEGSYHHFRQVLSPAEPRVLSLDRDGQRESERIMMASNNYLGLARDPRVMARAREALETWGVGAGGPNTIQGYTPLAEELEARLAAFKGCEAAMLSASGYAANLGCVTGLIGPGDVFFLDEADHASLVDAGRFSGAEIYVYRHGDLADLERQLEGLKGHPGYKLLATCGVFSMSGEVPPLAEIRALTKAHGVLLMVDDAHGTGVLGETGRGSTEFTGIHGQAEIVMGTFSKAFGCYGGFVAGSKDLITYLRHFARATMFSASLSPMTLGAVLGALEILETDPEPLRSVQAKASWLKRELELAGFELLDSKTPIVPLMIRDATKLSAFVAKAYDRGLFLSQVEAPAVPRGSERIRATVMATHSQDDLEKALEIFLAVGRELELIPAKKESPA